MIKSASLVVVGTGIKFLSHLTTEVKAYIEQSDKVLYLVNDPAMKDWILKVNNNAESLDFLYKKYILRKDCYQAITDYILDVVRKKNHVCFVLYGHPGVFAQSGIEAVKTARAEGFDAQLLPGISAVDCLFSDLLIDPSSCGCQFFEATDFVLYKRKFDPSSHLILWQVDVIGILDNPEVHDNKKGISVLISYLKKYYDEQHEMILYEAAQYPTFPPKIQPLMLYNLNKADFSPLSTLYIPPINNINLDASTLDVLGIKI